MCQSIPNAINPLPTLSPFSPGKRQAIDFFENVCSNPHKGDLFSGENPTSPSLTERHPPHILDK